MKIVTLALRTGIVCLPALALVACLQLDPEVYYIENLPVNMDGGEFFLIAGIALHISFIATIYPARRASRLLPAAGLRYD